MAGFVVSAWTVAAGCGRFGLRGGVPLIRFFNSGGGAAARFRCGFVALFCLSLCWSVCVLSLVNIGFGGVWLLLF